jgi:hypothetical protein
VSDLRDRIAAALFRRRWDLISWEDETEVCREMWRRDADAVIAALGLREEREDVASFQPGEIDDSMTPPRQKGRLAWTPSHRYVTEWEPDETD